MYLDFSFPAKRKEGGAPSYLAEVWAPQTSIRSASQRKSLWCWVLFMGVCGNPGKGCFICGPISCMTGTFPLACSSWTQFWKSYFLTLLGVHDEWIPDRSLSQLSDMQYTWILEKIQARLQLQTLLNSLWFRGQSTHTCLPKLPLSLRE